MNGNTCPASVDVETTPTRPLVPVNVYPCPSDSANVPTFANVELDVMNDE